MQPFSQFIYSLKYQLKEKDGTLVDLDMDATKYRVANALAKTENASDHWARVFRECLEYAIPAGRIMSNAGAGLQKTAVSTINCVVSDTIGDSMESIFTKLSEAAVTLKYGCGIGYSFSTLRPKGAFVHGAGASTSGPLSFMDVYDRMCNTIMSAGGRRGAQMATFRIDHPDVIDFIKAKREDGRLRYFNLSVLITEAFIEAVKTDSLWDLTWEGKIYNTIRARSS
jgi:ribonucleoside-diphosphate reductase alpha chain